MQLFWLPRWFYWLHQWHGPCHWLAITRLECHGCYLCSCRRLRRESITGHPESARSDVITSHIGGPLARPAPHGSSRFGCGSVVNASFGFIPIVNNFAVHGRCPLWCDACTSDSLGGSCCCCWRADCVSECVCLCVACAIIKCRKFHQTLQSGITCCCCCSQALLHSVCPCHAPVSVYDSIIFTANKRETAYHGQVLNGRQGKLRKFSFLFLLLFFCVCVFFLYFCLALPEQPNLNAQGVEGHGRRGSWARKKRWTETLWATAAGKCVCGCVCVLMCWWCA